MEPMFKCQSCRFRNWNWEISTARVHVAGKRWAVDSECEVCDISTINDNYDLSFIYHLDLKVFLEPRNIPYALLFSTLSFYIV